MRQVVTITRSCGSGGTLAVANGLLPMASKLWWPQELRLLAYRLDWAGELALEADRLVIARRRTHVAQRQPVFDERGSSVSLTGMQCDRVLADRAAERFRVHAIALNRGPVIH